MPSAIEAIQKGRSSLFKIPRKFCFIRPPVDRGSNPRTDFGDIPALAKLIAKHGIRNPLEGTMEGNKFMVGHGERRLMGLDYAIQHLGLSPKSDLALVPVRPENFAKGTADKDRLINHVILNEAKPLDLMEKGRAFDRLMKEHNMKEKEVAEELGFSPTTVRDCLRLINGAAEEVQDAVAAGKISATTASELVREVPDKGAQADVLAKATQTAEEAGSEKVTAKHLPVSIGKAAQSSRRRGSHPFAGKASTPDSPASNAHGEFVEKVNACQIPLSGKVNAAVITALVGSTYHYGYRITIPGQGRGEGFIQVHPNVKGPTADTEANAILLGLQQIRAEIELKTFKAKDTVLTEIDARLHETAKPIQEAADAKKGSAAPAKASAGRISNPVIKDRDLAAELKDVIDKIEAKDAEKDRLNTAKKILTFCKGKLDSKGLTRFLLGID